MTDLSYVPYTTVCECEHDLQPVYESYSCNYQKLECYRCSKCGAVFGANCINFINSVKQEVTDMTCLGCIFANNCIMYEPEMKACEDYTAEVTEITNKEAIEILKRRKTCMECVMAVSSVNMCNKCNTAFDLAIKALETRVFDEALSEDGLFPVMVTKEQFAKIRELSDKGEL